MILYLVEKIENNTKEVIAVKQYLPDARLLADTFSQSIVTRLELEEVYYQGIGQCQHWHKPSEIK